MREEAARNAFAELSKDEQQMVEDLFWRLKEKVKNFGDASMKELAFVLLLDKDEELARQEDELWREAKI
jgi:hypothetical protein